MKLALTLVLALALVSCARARPVLNLTDRPVPPTAQDEPLTKIEQAIVQAGAARGWSFERVEPGHLVATLARRTHKAVADVRFTRTSYNIVYRSSENLMAQGGEIHRNYNRWVQWLAREIDTRLAQLD